MSTNQPGTPDLDARFDRFLDRFQAEETVAAVLGGSDLPAAWVSAKLISRLFPVPLIHLDSEARLTKEELQRKLEPALDSGKVVLITLGPSTDDVLLSLMEELIRDGGMKVLKPQGWVSIAGRSEFRLLIHSPRGSFPFDESVSLRFHLP